MPKQTQPNTDVSLLTAEINAVQRETIARNHVAVADNQAVDAVLRNRAVHMLENFRGLDLVDEFFERQDRIEKAEAIKAQIETRIKELKVKKFVRKKYDCEN